CQGRSRSSCVDPDLHRRKSKPRKNSKSLRSGKTTPSITSKSGRCFVKPRDTSRSGMSLAIGLVARLRATTCQNTYCLALPDVL
ncbi:hypothetical protein CSHISOI_04238, partial [Colletotrichum shisoi]